MVASTAVLWTSSSLTKSRLDGVDDYSYGGDEDDEDDHESWVIAKSKVK